ncbi:MAG: hypothetical protein ACE5E8_11935 [Acidimicrobiia bacterium]
MHNHYILSSGNRRDEFGHPIPGDPVEWMYELLDLGVWGGNDDTPNFMQLQKGDRVLIQSAAAGFVATATVQSAPRRTRKSALRERNCTHEVSLKVRRFRIPVSRTKALRRQISRAAGDARISSTWANYFIRGVRPVSKAVFQTITG